MRDDFKEPPDSANHGVDSWAAWSVGRQRAGLSIPWRVTVFVGVGLTGAIIDLAVFLLLLSACGFALARALAIGVAMSWIWWLNRIVTFAERDRRRPLRQYLAFCLGCSIGAGVNWPVSVSIASLLGEFVAAKLFAASLGCVSGAAFNFICAMYVVYQPEKI